MDETSRSRIGFIGILLACAVILILVVGNVYVYLSFRTNPNLFFSMVNSAVNFPNGIVTAIFTPDSTVLTGSQIFADWYVGFAVALFFFYFLFIVTNLGASDREIGWRSVFFGLTLIPISIMSNLITLLRNQSSAGPSTATFASMGLVLGFSILNVAVWIVHGHQRLQRIRGFFSIVSSLAIVITFILVPIVLASIFFDIDPSQKVDWVAHVFCYVLGTVSSFLFIPHLRNLANPLPWVGDSPRPVEPGIFDVISQDSREEAFST